MGRLAAFRVFAGPARGHRRGGSAEHDRVLALAKDLLGWPSSTCILISRTSRLRDRSSLSRRDDTSSRRAGCITVRKATVSLPRVSLISSSNTLLVSLAVELDDREVGRFRSVHDS